jgi:hypothetical protein
MVVKSFAPMKRKLFTVKVQTAILVLGYDQEHAEKTARHIIRDEWPVRNLDKVPFSCEVRPMTEIPAGYAIDDYAEENSIDEPELLELPEFTVREWIERGAAPCYSPGRGSDR